MKIENLKKRYEFLIKEYEPSKECAEVGFRCDFEADDSGECPCQWAGFKKETPDLMLDET